MENQLKTIGLTDDQISVYKTLLSLGPSKAFKIALNSGVKRALTYKILDQLEAMSLIYLKEIPEAKVTTFYPTHPSSLEKLIEQKKQGVSAAESAFSEIIQNLTSSYNIANKKPNVQFFEGEKGLQYVFDDIIKQKADVLLFRSYLDNVDESHSQILDEHKLRRKKFGLKVRAISSRKPTKGVLEHDKDLGITRRYIPEEKFSLPAEINIYGNKVAIISYSSLMVTTIIESPEIRTSFAVLFELVWSQGVAPEEIIS